MRPIVKGGRESDIRQEQRDVSLERFRSGCTLWKRQRRLIRGWEERRKRRCSKERMERVKARECSNTH
ncbi:hypothetical protein TNCV_2000241 [Trichonephila clavipes]|nr:hypothetical protein TNCV_2000241 [Trichonephila clavipes]